MVRCQQTWNAAERRAATRGEAGLGWTDLMGVQGADESWRWWWTLVSTNIQTAFHHGRITVKMGYCITYHYYMMYSSTAEQPYTNNIKRLRLIEPSSHLIEPSHFVHMADLFLNARNMQSIAFTSSWQASGKRRSSARMHRCPRLDRTQPA